MSRRYPEPRPCPNCKAPTRNYDTSCTAWHLGGFYWIPGLCDDCWRRACQRAVAEAKMFSPIWHKILSLKRGEVLKVSWHDRIRDYAEATSR